MKKNIITNLGFSEKAADCILKERDYQDFRWNENTTPTCGIHTELEFLVFIDDYLTEAINILSRNYEPKASNDASHNMRKIAAMSLAILEIEEKTDILNNAENLPSPKTITELSGYVKALTNKAFNYKLSNEKNNILSVHADIFLIIVKTFDNLNIYPQRIYIS